MVWLRRFRSTILRSNLDEGFAEETRFHLDERIAEYVNHGSAILWRSPRRASR